MPSIDPVSDNPAAERGGYRQIRPEASGAAASLTPAAHALEAAAEALEAGEQVAPETLSAISPGAPGDGRRTAGTEPLPRQMTAAEPLNASEPGSGGGPSTAEAGGNRRIRPEVAPPPPGGRARTQSGGPRRRRPKKAAAIVLIALSLALILAAVGVGGYPFYTDIMASRHQKVLAADFARASRETGAARLKLLQQYADRNFSTGSAITKIIIPAINVDSVVVQGTTDQALNVGAGHYPQTPLPGEVGNVAIAGHRTMNGHPFGDLNKLAPGDKVILQTPFDTYTYQLIPAFDGHANPWVTAPTDWSVIEVPTQDHLLTLTTCNPPGQQTTRLVARATLVSTQPV